MKSRFHILWRSKECNETMSSVFSVQYLQKNKNKKKNNQINMDA